jgi:hypothetical protein
MEKGVWALFLEERDKTEHLRIFGMLKVKCRWGTALRTSSQSTRQTPPPASDDKTERRNFVFIAETLL